MYPWQEELFYLFFVHRPEARLRLSTIQQKVHKFGHVVCASCYTCRTTQFTPLPGTYALIFQDKIVYSKVDEILDWLINMFFSRRFTVEIQKTLAATPPHLGRSPLRCLQRLALAA